MMMFWPKGSYLRRRERDERCSNMSWSLFLISKWESTLSDCCELDESDKGSSTLWQLQVKRNSDAAKTLALGTISLRIKILGRWSLTKEIGFWVSRAEFGTCGMAADLLAISRHPEYNSVHTKNTFLVREMRVYWVNVNANSLGVAYSDLRIRCLHPHVYTILSYIIYTVLFSNSWRFHMDLEAIFECLCPPPPNRENRYLTGGLLGLLGCLQFLRLDW